jgi:hypothetical protein
VEGLHSILNDSNSIKSNQSNEKTKKDITPKHFQDLSLLHIKYAFYNIEDWCNDEVYKNKQQPEFQHDHAYRNFILLRKVLITFDLYKENYFESTTTNQNQKDSKMDNISDRLIKFPGASDADDDGKSYYTIYIYYT